MVTLCSYMYYTHKFRSWQLLGIKHLRFMGWPTRSISLNFMCNNPKHCSSNAISVSCRNDLYQRFVTSIGNIFWPTKSTFRMCRNSILYFFAHEDRRELNSLKSRIVPHQNCRNFQYILPKRETLGTSHSFFQCFLYLVYSFNLHINVLNKIQDALYYFI